MIDPDTKNWTWVLERACPECGFDTTLIQPDDVAALLLEQAEVWEGLLADGAIRPGRPDDATWSTLEYACHVRDVLGKFIERVDAMLEEDDPLFANWDQDATAITDDYESQDPRTVVADLAERAVAFSLMLSAVARETWLRPGRRSDGAAFTIATLVRYMIHDPIHHVDDVRRQLA